MIIAGPRRFKARADSNARLQQQHRHLSSSTLPCEPQFLFYLLLQSLPRTLRQRRDKIIPLFRLPIVNRIRLGGQS